jgi:hypothetical protein
MNVTPVDAYVTKGGQYVAGGSGRAVSLQAQARIRPALPVNATGLPIVPPEFQTLQISIAQAGDSASIGNVYGNPQMSWNANYPSGAPIPPGDQATIPSMRIVAGTFQIKSSVRDADVGPDGANDPIPLYDGSASVEPVGFERMPSSAISSDAPNLPLPVWGGANPPRTIRRPITDGTGAFVGIATYTRLKSVRDLSFTDWCIVTEVDGQKERVIAPLAQNEWQLSLDSSVGNQKASAKASHVTNIWPVISGPALNTIANPPSKESDPYGTATQTVTK